MAPSTPATGSPTSTARWLYNALGFEEVLAAIKDEAINVFMNQPAGDMPAWS